MCSLQYLKIGKKWRAIIIKVNIRELQYAGRFYSLISFCMQRIALMLIQWNVSPVLQTYRLKKKTVLGNRPVKCQSEAK